MLNNRLDRILYIQQVLVQGGVLNKQQTADRFGVSEKTIQRDLDTLRNHFADSEPRREILYNSAKGGYLLDDTLSRFLTSSEILAVCKILLESRSMVKEEMFPILDKLILACTPLDRLNQVKDLISNERFHYVEPQHGRKFIESLWEIGKGGGKSQPDGNYLLPHPRWRNTGAYHRASRYFIQRILFLSGSVY